MTAIAIATLKGRAGNTTLARTLEKAAQLGAQLVVIRNTAKLITILITKHAFTNLANYIR